MRLKTLLPGLTEKNYSKDALTEADVRAILAASGSVAAVLNTRHATAVENGWKDTPPSGDTFVSAAVAEPNLLRRPIVLANGKIVVGKNETAWKGL